MANRKGLADAIESKVRAAVECYLFPVRGFRKIFSTLQINLLFHLFYTRNNNSIFVCR